MEDETIKEILLRIEQNQLRFFSFMEALVPGVKPDPTLWIDQLELQKFLKMSRATAFRHRKEGKLPFIKKGSKAFFYLPDIFEVKDHYLK